jgi:pyruvate,water dikinase
MSELLPFEQIRARDAETVGGKGLSLGRMVSAGFPVPPGFCITTTAYRRLHGQPLASDPILVQQIAAAYRQLGGGPVAVRSSATAEDGAVTSFAGQQETILGVRGEDDVCAAIARCWESLHSDRAVAYRRHQGVGDEGLEMAVVVQRLVPAEVAGVLFTRDPLDTEGKRMLVEAAWGLGESVVSGQVAPDRYHLDRDTGQVIEQHTAAKTIQVTPEGRCEVPAEKQNQPCLDSVRLQELAELGGRVEAFYGEPRDIEWAWAEGQFWLLQARPITTAGAAELEQVRREEIAALAARVEPGGTVWSRFNLAEVLPEPTPMTWAVVRRLLSGRGGFGLMYRDLGFDPDPALDEEGVFDLVCGRPYCNLSREARQHCRQLPFEHNFAALKADPRRAMYPTPGINAARLDWRFWLTLPVVLPLLMGRMIRGQARRQRLRESIRRRFLEEIAAAFAHEVDAAWQQDLAVLEPNALLEQLEYWTRRTLVDFARDSLKPTALAAIVLGEVERLLARKLGAERARATVGELMMKVRPEPRTDLAGAIRNLEAGRLSRADFLRQFGHRGQWEMELAKPRWAEDDSALPGAPVSASGEALPSEPRGDAGGESAGENDEGTVRAKIPKDARLSSEEEKMLVGLVSELHDFLRLRESGKHYLLMGYALIRRTLVELDRRYRLGGGVFYLTPDELPRLIAGENLSGIIVRRRRRRTIARSLPLPPVIFSDDLEAIGRPQPTEGAGRLQGVPLSAGVAEAPALVLEQPRTDNLPAEPYVLVCPSTDPAWVPLFAQARGLVMEIGGVLSHGAIVAREFGLPAVAGLPDVQRRLRTGQLLRVDGSLGVVTVLSSSSTESGFRGRGTAPSV